MMNTPDAIRATHRAIVEQQAAWAQQQGLELDKRGWICAADAQHNLIVPMSQRHHLAFGNGAGNELRTKMRAPHSSSVLAYNAFAAAERAGVSWADIFEHSDHHSAVPALVFEQRRPTRWRGIPPHLDAELQWPRRLLAFESKLTEPYGEKRAPSEALAAYLRYPASNPIWGGATQLHAVAQQLALGSVKHQLLDTPQLIKHSLGLRNAQHPGLEKTKEAPTVELVLLWFDARHLSSAAEAVSQQLIAELDWFKDQVAEDISVQQMTHQQLIQHYEAQCGLQPWVGWLKQRYSG